MVDTNTDIEISNIALYSLNWHQNALVVYNISHIPFSPLKNEKEI